jgi:hypothetical protein
MTIFLTTLLVDIDISLGFVQVFGNWITGNSQGKRMDVVLPMFYF